MDLALKKKITRKKHKKPMKKSSFVLGIYLNDRIQIMYRSGVIFQLKSCTRSVYKQKKSGHNAQGGLDRIILKNLPAK